MTTTSPSRTRRPVAVVTAALAALLVWTIADPIAGIRLDVHSGGKVQHIGYASVLAASLLAGLLGWALSAAFGRFTARARKIWTVNALIALVVSLIGPFAAVTGAAFAVLVCLHLVVGGVLIRGLRPATVL